MIKINDYTEMEVRVNGEWKKVNVLKTLEDGSCLYLVGEMTSNGSYMSGGCIPAEQYREIKRNVTKTVVKSATDIYRALVDAGYELEGRYWRTKGDGNSFVPDMFNYCGKEPKTYSFNPEWLEEVEVTVED